MSEQEMPIGIHAIAQYWKNKHDRLQAQLAAKPPETELATRLRDHVAFLIGLYRGESTVTRAMTEAADALDRLTADLDNATKELASARAVIEFALTRYKRSQYETGKRLADWLREHPEA